jgi:hypothetical protein
MIDTVDPIIQKPEVRSQNDFCLASIADGGA